MAALQGTIQETHLSLHSAGPLWEAVFGMVSQGVVGQDLAWMETEGWYLQSYSDPESAGSRSTKVVPVLMGRACASKGLLCHLTLCWEVAALLSPDDRPAPILICQQISRKSQWVLELSWGEAGNLCLRSFLIGWILGANHARCLYYHLRMRLVFVNNNFDVEVRLLPGSSVFSFLATGSLEVLYRNSMSSPVAYLAGPSVSHG